MPDREARLALRTFRVQFADDSDSDPESWHAFAARDLLGACQQFAQDDVDYDSERTSKWISEGYELVVLDVDRRIRSRVTIQGEALIEFYVSKGPDAAR